MHHEQMLEIVIDLLSQTTHGKITDVIPIQNIREQLKIIENNLEKKVELPVDLRSESTYHIFRTASVRSTLLGNRIIVEINFSILNQEIFT